jgi:hypothetical protein
LIVKVAAGILMAGIFSLVMSIDMFGRTQTGSTSPFRPAWMAALATTGPSHEDCSLNSSSAQTTGGSPSTID